MRNCTQPRPADHNSKSAPRQMPTPQGYSSSSPYAGSGAPSSMYMGVTPYGASPFNGTSMPPYDGPLQLSATPAYSRGPMIGTGRITQRTSHVNEVAGRASGKETSEKHWLMLYHSHRRCRPLKMQAWEPYSLRRRSM